MDHFFNVGDRVIRKVDKGLYAVSAVLLALMMLHVVITVLCIKIFRVAFPIAVDYTGYMFLVVVVLAYAGYQYKDGFVKITMLTGHFRGKLKFAVDLFVIVLVTAFYAFLAYRCGIFALDSFHSGKAMLSSGWKIWPYTALMALGFYWCAAVALFQALSLICRGKMIVDEDSAEAVASEDAVTGGEA